MATATEARLTLITDEKGIWVIGGWPQTTRVNSQYVNKWRKPNTDLLDIQVKNGRAIYRIAGFLTEEKLFSCELAYEEVYPAPKDVV